MFNKLSTLPNNNLSSQKSSEVQKSELFMKDPSITEESVEYQAYHILQNEDPISYIMGQYTQIHVGDDEAGELLLMTIGCQCCSNTEGIQPDLTGMSGGGKSDCCKAMLHLNPNEYVITGSRSPLALYHMELNPGSIVFFDDTEKFSDIEEQFIKTTTSQFQQSNTRYYTDMKKEGAKKSREISIPPRQLFWITSKDSSFDIQILNRFIKIQIDDSPEQDLAVLQHQREKAKIGSYRFEVTQEVEVCREIIRHLKNYEPQPVQIPYVDLIEWKSYQNRRNFPMFIDIIKASAAFNQYQRTKSEDNFIIGNLEDFDRAARLWSTIESSQITGLTPTELDVLRVISNNNGITQSGIAKILEKDKSTVSRAIHGIKQADHSYKGGLMNNLKGGGLDYHSTNHTYQYSGDIFKTTGMVLLTDRAEAQRLINEASCCPTNSSIYCLKNPVNATEAFKEDLQQVD